jgi:hypothetical protein
MTKLSPQAKSALDSLQEKHLAYTIAKGTIEAELKREASNRLSSIRQDRDMALRLAAESGVPKTQLGKAIGTSNYRTVQEILAETESVVRSSSGDPGLSSKILVERHSEIGLYKVSITNFGENSLTGSAIVGETDNQEIETVAGDQFVLPQIYRAGQGQFLLDQITKLD